MAIIINTLTERFKNRKFNQNQNVNQKSVKQIGCHFFLNIERCHSERGTSRGIDVTTMFPISSEERVEKS